MNDHDITLLTTGIVLGSQLTTIVYALLQWRDGRRATGSVEARRAYRVSSADVFYSSFRLHRVRHSLLRQIGGQR